MNPSLKNIVPSDSVFLDANILLEVVLGRMNEKIALEILETFAGNLYVSALTAHLVVHFGKERAALPVLQQFLADYYILPLDTIDFSWGFANIKNTDYEDVLQLAVATRHKCDHFITFDKQLVKSYRDLSTIRIAPAV